MDAPDLWRDATPDDEPWLQSVWQHTHGARFAGLPPQVIAQLSAHQFHAQMASYRDRYPDLHVTVLQHQGVDVGRLLLSVQPEMVRILDISVLPDHRKMGVASRSIRRVQKLAGDRPVGLAVHLHERTNRELYEGLGFVPTEATDTHQFMEWRR